MSARANAGSWVDKFVNKPILSIILSIAFCCAGIYALVYISVMQFPRLESASLVITTNYTGASADIIKGFVTDPIERVASTVPGVDYVDSVSKAGSSTVTAWLNLNEDSTRALAEMSAKLSQVGFELPQAAEDPVITVSRTDRPHALFYLNVKTQGYDLTAITDFMSRQVTPILNNIPGVQKVDIEGNRTPAMRIWLAPDQMHAYGLSAADINQALKANNTLATFGFTDSQQQKIDIVANTQLQTVAEFENIIVKNLGNRNIHLKDIARIERAHTQPMISARLNQEDTVYLAVWPLPGENEIAIGDKLYQSVAEINKTLPNGLSINFAYDGTLYMRDSLKEITTTLVETIIIVGIVVLLMMGSMRTALVPLVTIPISILGAIAAIYLVGFSLNLLTVLAIVLSVGLVVDDAIVVVENVSRHMRNGHSRLQAALISSRQLLIPIISMTLTLAMVYIPIGFLDGLTGILFKEFAFSLAIAVIISGIIAITLSPIMSANVALEGGKESRFTKKVNALFDALSQRYVSVLKRCFAWTPQLIVFAFVVTLLMVPFYLGSAKELAPIEDQSNIFVLVQSPPDSSLTYNEDRMTSVVDSLLAIEGTNQMWQNLYPAGGFGGLEFKSSSERDYSTSEKLPEIYGYLSGSAGLNLLPIMPSSLPTAGQFDIEFIVKAAAPYEEMKEYADKLVGAAFQSGEFLYADTDLKIDLPQMLLSFDANKIADHNMTMSSVSEQLSVYLTTNYANRYDASGKAYKVIPILDEVSRSNPDEILSLPIKTPSGDLITLAAVASIQWQTAPRQLNSFGQQNAFRVFGGILPSSTKEKALAALEQAAADILPAHYYVDYAGESREIRRSSGQLITTMGLSLFIVYLILTIQFNSFRDPLIVFGGCVFLALSGALILPFFGLTTLNIYSQIGLITLIGLIAKNGILIVEFANSVQEAGKSKLQAITEAAQTRLRPILMTTAATVFGHFPLVLVTGAGAEARNSIGIILVVGMLVGTLFTLFILPMFYWLFAKERNAPAIVDKEVVLQHAA
ncbi:efflux RND transporter permease subunit [Flocculibacter collagenilyticus]|uniref:efflux RND transporter permease subunit n=1 Tax=Flocculibacter collagenilyticus TaxID=2744479 RepID=UPI0018F7320E|nr:efflux RND transporter permease subunit [Flocculibacter collagenilyticus]